MLVPLCTYVFSVFKTDCCHCLNILQVFGLENEDDTVGVLLGSYNYTTAGEPLQHFKVQENVGDRAFDTIEVKILTNHGNIHYTCLYRFRVHGKPVHDDGLW